MSVVGSCTRQSQGWLYITFHCLKYETNKTKLLSKYLDLKDKSSKTSGPVRMCYCRWYTLNRLMKIQTTACDMTFQNENTKLLVLNCL